MYLLPSTRAWPSPTRISPHPLFSPQNCIPQYTLGHWQKLGELGKRLCEEGKETRPPAVTVPSSSPSRGSDPVPGFSEAALDSGRSLL